MAKFTDKISSLINQQVPEFVLEQHPKFLEFLKTYYTFMESAELGVTSIQTTDGILLETETAQENELILDGSRLDTDRTQLDAGDKIILESSTYGKFTRGEIITGQTSNATTTVLAEDLGNNRLFISAQDKFIDGETVVGASSNATAIINNYKPNPVNNIQELLNFRDPDKAISNFLTKFRNEFLNTLPETLSNGVDKRKLIKNVKSLYRAKGTNRGHQLFFRLLFGLNSETIYPREQMLRTSDGTWDTKTILRAIGTVGDTINLIGRTITGETSEATAVVENVFKFQIGTTEVSEIILDNDTISGTFQISEVLRGTINDESDIFIKATITGIPKTISITNDGNLYTEGDSVLVSGGGNGAIIQVDSVGRGGITDFVIASAGSGYEIGDAIEFTNTGTGGGSASAKVSVVNGGFTQETSTSTVDDHIVLEDETVRGDPYTGNKVVQESGTGTGDITDIRIISSGNNYQSLPTVAVDDTNGSSAVVYANSTDVGRILGLKIVESGAGYEASPSPPTLLLPSYIIVSGVSGTFQVGETVTGLDSTSTAVSATVVSYTSGTGILKVSSPTGQFAEKSTITSAGGATATVEKNDLGTATVSIGAVVDTTGTYINQDGHLSDDSMKVQDSLYYQDFSYVIKVGRSISDWRDSFKKTVHTSGFFFSGQVNIETSVDARLRSFTTINSGVEYEGVQSVLNTLFSTIFGRRLGTTTDGTTLRVSPQLGVDPDFNDSTSEHFTSNTRDVTLHQHITLIGAGGIIKEVTDIRSNTTKFGVPVAGPTLHSINKLVLGEHFANRITIEQLNALTLTGTKNSNIDGEQVILGDFPFKLKTNFAIPAEVWQVSSDSFDEDRDTFDETNITFDAA